MKKKILFLLPVLLVILTGCGKKCPEGFNLEDNKCVREIERIEPKVSYKCDQDAVLEGTNCVKNILAEPTKSIGCKEGLAVENGYCVGTLKEAAVNAYQCDSGEELKGNKCIKSTLDNDALTKTAKCPDGYNMLEGGCWKGARPPISDNCDVYEHIYEGCKCDAPDILGPDYFCYMSYKTVEYDYKCAAGTVLKNNKCYKQTESNATTYKKCPAGYTLNGDECTRFVNEAVGEVLSCENGFTLENNQCKKVEITFATRISACSNEYEIIDDYCVKREVKEVE